MKEFIICSAIHYETEERNAHLPINIQTGIVIAGRRHHDCFNTIRLLKGTKIEHPCVQGFLTNTNRFVDRFEAFKIAEAAGQIIRQEDYPKYEGERTLISEDLY